MKLKYIFTLPLFFSTFMLLSGCPDVSGVWGESSLQATVEKNSGRVKIYFSFIVLDGLKNSRG